MIMKRLLLVVCFGMEICFSMLSQNLQIAIDECQIIYSELGKEKREIEVKNRHLQDSINKVENLLKVLSKQTTTAVEAELMDYNSFVEMMNDNLIDKLKRSPKTQTTELYIKVLEATQSLETGYVRSDNESYIKDFKKVDASSFLTNKHRESFEEIFSQLKDYRYAMFELSRLMDMVDSKAVEKSVLGSQYIKQLEEENETDAVYKVPFVKRQFVNYVVAHFNGREKDKAKIRKEMKMACPEAFE